MKWYEVKSIMEEAGIEYFSDFMGLIRVRPSGKIAATVVQTRPGQFATMPVATQ